MDEVEGLDQFYSPRPSMLNEQYNCSMGEKFLHIHSLTFSAPAYMKNCFTDTNSKGEL